MNVTLIQIDLILGARVLLKLLKDMGHNAKLLQINIRYVDILSEDDMQIIYDYVIDSDMVGLSFNTFYAPIARTLAMFLKKKGVKYLICGGNHATAFPEEVIEYCDIVVKYEAEKTLIEIMDNINDLERLKNIHGIIIKSSDAVHFSDKPPEIVWQLDTIPFQSLDMDLIKFFDLERKIYTPQKTNLFPLAENIYFLLASRGCPFTCTYCSNSLYHSLDKNFSKVRKRSISNIISEMEYAVENGFTSFYITDDNFFSFGLDELKEFNMQYKSKIKKPFSVVGINPNNFRSPSTEEKLSLLIDCGLSDIRVGIQSGSEKTLKYFKRGYKADDVIRLLNPLERHRKTIWPHPYDKLNIALDFICDSPWEADEDKIATIKLALKILKQYSIFFYTLVFLPGTELYHQALESKWIDDNYKDIYFRGIAGVNDNIFNRLLFLIAVMKEREITISEKMVDHVLDVAKHDLNMAQLIINSLLQSITMSEQYHKVNLNHAALHPYLTGFNEWVKTAGEIGKKVLFRSYHKPYG